MKKYTKKDIELAWAAGFYDGEGSSKAIYYHYKTKKGKARNPSRNVCMSVSQCELAPLERFKKAVNNLGHINGPYHYKAQKRPYWIWSSSCASAKEVFKKLKPYLSQAKKLQYELVSDSLNSYVPNRQKGWIHD
jgi:hypothetical protein